MSLVSVEVLCGVWFGVWFGVVVLFEVVAVGEWWWVVSGE